MTLVVILCQDWKDACDSFDIFANYLDGYAPDSILECYESSNIIDTIEWDGEHFRYLFTDYHYKRWFEEMTDIIIDSNSFFNGILENYQWLS